MIANASATCPTIGQPCIGTNFSSPNSASGYTTLQASIDGYGSPAPLARRDDQFRARHQAACNHQQDHRSGQPARLQRHQRQRAVRNELTLRDEDHTRHGEREHQREREQRIDRTVGDAVLCQQQRDVEIHASGDISASSVVTTCSAIPRKKAATTSRPDRSPATDHRYFCITHFPSTI